MSTNDLSNNKDKYNSGLLMLNNFMLEQAEINEYTRLVKSINCQLDRLLEPVVTVYSEYGTDSKELQIKEINANQNVLNVLLKIGGKKTLSTVTPVNDDMYGSMTLDRLDIISGLSEASGGAIPSSVSKAIDKALGLKCYLVLSFMVDGQLYGTTLTALKEQPEEYILELLKTYAHFTSISLKRVLTEQALKKSEQELKTITDNMSDLVSMTDAEGKFTHLSGNHYDLFGYEKDELLGRYAWEIVYSEDLESIAEMFRSHALAGKNGQAEFRVVRKDGKLTWVDTVGSILYDDGVISGALFVTRDITERKRTEQALRASEQELKTVTENMTDLVSMTDTEGRINYVTGSYHQLLGYDKEELLGKRVFEVVFEEDLPEVSARFQKAIATGENDCVEYRAVKKDGTIVWLETLGNFLTDSNGSVNGAIFSLRDITERKEAEDYIRYISFHDQLTGLYNRHYFEHCRKELESIPVISVIVTDINSLKLVNDTYGHEYGDQIIKEYAKILKQSFKHSDLIFRWGGDEFIIILKNTEEAKSWELYNRLEKHCGKTYVKDIPLSISVGISSKVQGENIEKALSEAENMMYRNKIKESKKNKNMILMTILQTLSDISHETKDHTERMKAICYQFGKHLNLSSSELSRLEMLIMLHDIGLISVDRSIFSKETVLTNEEWAEIKKHPGVGYHITRSSEEFACVAEEILTHHERWDGNGYPQGLEGENIPYLARVLNLIDSYEVMCYGRPYKKKLSTDEIIEEIERCSGKQFDPDLAEDFVAFLKESYIKV